MPDFEACVIINITHPKRGEGCPFQTLPRDEIQRKGMMKDGAEPLKVVLFIVRHYGVVERLPVLG